jgi:hypothetical protein
MLDLIQHPEKVGKGRIPGERKNHANFPGFQLSLE